MKNCRFGGLTHAPVLLQVHTRWGKSAPQRCRLRIRCPWADRCPGLACIGNHMEIIWKAWKYVEKYGNIMGKMGSWRAIWAIGGPWGASKTSSQHQFHPVWAPQDPLGLPKGRLIDFFLYFFEDFWAYNWTFELVSGLCHYSGWIRLAFYADSCRRFVFSLIRNPFRDPFLADLGPEPAP